VSGDTTRAKILETAGEVFAEKGYEAATIREICERAGVNLAAVNYYFRGKEPLYSEVLIRAHSCGTQDGDSPAWPPDATPGAKLKFFIHRMLTHMLSITSEPWEARLTMREIMSPTPAGKRVFQDHFRQVFHQLHEILDEILPPHMPDHKRHQIAFSILGQCGWYRGLGKVIPMLVSKEELQDHYSIDDLAEHVAQVSLAALGLAPPLAGGRDVGPRRKLASAGSQVRRYRKGER
jgi:TetR/AcrR family transcriptional regulator, regulator of cefoperazone and chloramphenicol sensitivity